MVRHRRGPVTEIVATVQLDWVNNTVTVYRYATTINLILSSAQTQSIIQFITYNSCCYFCMIANHAFLWTYYREGRPIVYNGG